MSWSEILERAGERMASAPPFAVVEALDALLGTLDPALHCVAYLADYRLEELRPIPPAQEPPERLEGTLLGRAFVTQRAVRLPDRAGRPPATALPLTVRGDRLGVLVVEGLPPPDPHGRPGQAGRPSPFERLAVSLAQALVVAGQVTDVYRVARRAGPLTLAAEMQWDRLPGRSLDAGYAMIAGQLEPAHRVVGDAYDWVCDPSGLSALLVDGSGHGTQAAGNTNFTVAAVRNARRQGADLAGMARLADQALHARFAGAMFASAILLDLDPRTLDLQIVTAGAGVVVHAGPRRARRLDVGGSPPLGAEEDHPYTATTISLSPGDRLVVASDGVTDAQIESIAFGDRLDRLVQSYRLLGATELVRAVVRDLRTFHAGNELADDAVVLCLDVARPPDP